VRGRGRDALAAAAGAAVPPDAVAQAGRAAAPSGGLAVTARSLVRVVTQEHIPGLAEVTVLVDRGGRVVPVAMRLDGAKGHRELVEFQY
jgi:hypothetical protein